MTARAATGRIDRPPWWLVVVAVLAVGLAVRLAFLAWSPLPATLDGIRYARLAADSLSAGRLPLSRLDADEVVFTTLLSVAGTVTGRRPLTLAQPLAAAIGAAIGLTGVVVATRLGSSIGLHARARYRAGAVAGLALAVDGLLLRRSGTPDEEALGLVLVPLFAIAAWRALRTRRPAWVVVAGLLAVTLPPLHNFSSLVAAMVLIALVVAHAVERPTLPTVATGLAVGVGFWGYFLGYFEAASRLGVRVTYEGILRDRPGVFLAWLVVLVVGTAWLRTTTPAGRRLALGAPLLGFFGLLGANAVRPVFPGTVPTAPRVLWLVAPYLVVVGLFVHGTGVLGRGGEDPDRARAGPVALALTTGPLVVVLFAVTSSLTPQFMGAAVRGQNFLHVAVVGVAAVVAVAATRRTSSGRLRRGLVIALLIAAVVTLPLGYLSLDTGTPPNTTLESDFAGAGFASTSLPGAFATEHPRSRIAIHWYGANASVVPVAEWVAGGPPPDCPTVAERSWTTTGVHLFPRSPGRIAPDAYRSWVTRNDVVYASGPGGPTLVVPERGRSTCEEGPRAGSN